MLRLEARPSTATRLGCLAPWEPVSDHGNGDGGLGLRRCSARRVLLALLLHHGHREAPASLPRDVARAGGAAGEIANRQAAVHVASRPAWPAGFARVRTAKHITRPSSTWSSAPKAKSVRRSAASCTVTSAALAPTAASWRTGSSAACAEAATIN